MAYHLHWRTTLSLVQKLEWLAGEGDVGGIGGGDGGGGDGGGGGGA